MGRARRTWISRNDHELSTEEVFTRIYQKRLWSGDERYSSGDGSRHTSVVIPYINEVKAWAKHHDGKNLVAVDLGCGDFHLGRELYEEFGRYIGLDIVQELIELHRTKYGSPNLSFQCRNAVNDELPEGDVIFVRQVLQHLSNEQILKIIPKITKFNYAIVTEHVPEKEFLAQMNLDKPHGGGIRLARKSGVYLQEPPFSLLAKQATVLLDLPASDNPRRDGRIVTTCYHFT